VSCSLTPSLSSTRNNFKIKYSITKVVIFNPLFFSLSNALYKELHLFLLELTRYTTFNVSKQSFFVHYVSFSNLFNISSINCKYCAQIFYNIFQAQTNTIFLHDNDSFFFCYKIMNRFYASKMSLNHI
jgi:hypothetical protein